MHIQGKIISFMEHKIPVGYRGVGPVETVRQGKNAEQGEDHSCSVRALC